MKTLKTLVISAFLFISLSVGLSVQAQQMEEIPKNFPEYLPMFLDTYNNNSAYIFLYLSDAIGFVTASNQGVYCYAEMNDAATSPWCTTTDENAPCFQINPDIPYDVYSTTPAGSFCEGYPGVANGYYYAPITSSDLPSFTVGLNDDGESMYGGIPIPNGLVDAPFMKVTVISGEWHSCYLYFVKIDEDWYFICQSFCDCGS